MFRNLDAEQARRGLTDEKTAKILCIKRSTYAAKKINGTFKINECIKLCQLFKCTFEYLFDTQIPA